MRGTQHADLAGLDQRRATLERLYYAANLDDPPPELMAVEAEILRAPARTIEDLAVKIRQLRREAGSASVGDYLVQFEQECQKIFGYARTKFYDGHDD